jgi:hypothetical protein
VITIKVPAGKSYFRGSKSLDGNTYLFTFRWNTTSEKWYMDIKGLSNTVDIRGIACLCGKDLLGKHGYSELGELWVIDNQGQDADPDLYTFGGRHTISYIPVDEIE